MHCNDGNLQNDDEGDEGAEDDYDDDEGDEDDDDDYGDEKEDEDEDDYEDAN